MIGIEIGETVARRHAPLVQRAEAIAAAHGQAAGVLLRDAADRTPLPPRAHLVTLERGEQPGIERMGPSRLALRYRDPAGEAALEALVA